MSNYVRRRYKRFDGDISVKVDLSNYASKTDLKNVSHVDVSSFALKSNLAKLSTVVKNDVVKKTEYNNLVTKVDNIGTTNFVKKTKYEKHGTDFEDKIDKIDKKYLMLPLWLKKQILIPKLLK